MIIGYDGKRAVQNNTGLGNYSRLMVDVLHESYPDNEYRLYAPRRRENSRLAPLIELPGVSLHLPDRAIWQRHSDMWRVWGMTRQLIRDGVELYHGLSGELPLNIGQARIPTVVTVHDLIFRHHPECYAAVDRNIYDRKFRMSARAATRVIAISECTKRDLVNFYGIDPEKIDVVYQGCAAQFRRRPSPQEIDRVTRKYGLHRPYIISVGTIEERKNQMQAVRGVRGLPEEMEVVLVGRKTDYARTIESYCRTYHSDHRVKFIEQADFSELPALYAGAFCSTYTSRFEGFGIPVIESLSVGTPVVVASGSCLEEAAGPDAPVVDPDDVEGWINTVKELVNYPEARRKIAAAGQRYVARFSDEAMAEGTMRAYLRAMDSFRRQ